MSSEMNYIDGANNVSADIFGLFLPVSEENDLYTFLGDTVLQAEPMKLNLKKTQELNITEMGVVCSVVKLSDTVGGGTEVIGKLIPMGGTSTSRQTSYSVMSAKYLNDILNCFREAPSPYDKLVPVEDMFLQLLELLNNKVQSYDGPGNRITETARVLLRMFNGFNFITRAQVQKELVKLDAKCSPWLHLYRVVRLLNIAVIFNNDNIAAIYQHIISVAKLQFNVKDIPALKATLDLDVSDDQDISGERMNIQVTGIESTTDYLKIVKQANVKNAEKCTILYGVRG